MRRSAKHFIAAFLFSTLATTIQAQTCPHGCNQGCSQGCHNVCHNPCNMPEELSRNVAPLTPAPDFLAFTGKVVKNKVRLRHQPNLDSPILKEMNQGDLLVIVGETEDFYAVQPPSGTKAYVFRTYILDNVVEGNKVNVRLEPDVDSPVIGQLSAGDKVDGTVHPKNNKWIEIAPPPTTRFFISKDYIEKLGDANLMSNIEKKRNETQKLLDASFATSQNEMQKPFPEINLDPVYANYNKIIKQSQEFPGLAARAQELLETLQDNYLQKKIAFLEQKAKTAQDEWQNKNTQLNDQMKAQQQRLAQLEQQIRRESVSQRGNSASQPKMERTLNSKMAAWLPIEEAVYRTWAAQNGNRPMEEFYNSQRMEPVVIKGVIESYTRVIKNKPGDYLLINQDNNVPFAFLYSTQINLQDYLGKDVTLHVAHRPNNHFAFPAFFVLKVE